METCKPHNGLRFATGRNLSKLAASLRPSTISRFRICFLSVLSLSSLRKVVFAMVSFEHPFWVYVSCVSFFRGPRPLVSFRFPSKTTRKGIPTPKKHRPMFGCGMIQVTANWCLDEGQWGGFHFGTQLPTLTDFEAAFLPSKPMLRAWDLARG